MTHSHSSLSEREKMLFREEVNVMRTPACSLHALYSFSSAISLVIGIQLVFEDCASC